MEETLLRFKKRERKPSMFAKIAKQLLLKLCQPTGIRAIVMRFISNSSALHRTSAQTWEAI
jgi:hypothetical protein